MATTPRVAVSAEAVDDDGVIAMGSVIEAHAPELAGARARFFGALASVVAEDPATHELLRLATAEDTGCRLCRNLRSRAAMEAGVDEPVVEQLRAGRTDALATHQRAALELGATLRNHPGDAGGPANGAAVLDRRFATAVVMSCCRALADGKALVALGLEPEAMEVRLK